MAKKRANGEGSIRKRKDGRWEGRYTAGHDPETGKAIYKNVLGRTQAEVKEKLKTAIKETQALDQSKVGKYTVGEWMEVWFEDYAKIKVRPSSHQTYRGYIDNHIDPNIGDIPLEKRLGALGDRMGKLLFKIAVEESMMMRLLAMDESITSSDLEYLREWAIQAVRKTDGGLSFDDILRAQR